MFELVNQNLPPDVFCKTVLCECDPSQDEKFGNDAVFSANLVPPLGRPEEHLKDIYSRLENIVSDISPKNVILPIFTWNLPSRPLREARTFYHETLNGLYEPFYIIINQNACLEVQPVIFRRC